LWYYFDVSGNDFVFKSSESICMKKVLPEALLTGVIFFAVVQSIDMNAAASVVAMPASTFATIMATATATGAGAAAGGVHSYEEVKNNFSNEAFEKHPLITHGMLYGFTGATAVTAGVAAGSGVCGLMSLREWISVTPPQRVLISGARVSGAVIPLLACCEFQRRKNQSGYDLK
jgi:hypothetical protein